MHTEVQRIAREAGVLALDYFKRLATLTVEAKGPLDLVTLADRDVEKFITEQLRKTFPGDGIFGEEGASVRDTTGRTWVIDPIDGTFNFVRGGDQWAISIGLYEKGAPAFGVIHAPMRRETLVGGAGLKAMLNGIPLAARVGLDRQRAAVGVGFHPTIPTETRLAALRYIFDDLRMSFRCCGSATASLLEVARGQVDGYIGYGESTWDVMAALPVLSQIGIANTVDWSKTPLSAKLNFACGTPDFLEAVRPLLHQSRGAVGSAPVTDPSRS